MGGRRRLTPPLPPLSVQWLGEMLLHSEWEPHHFGYFSFSVFELRIVYWVFLPVIRVIFRTVHKNWKPFSRTVAGWSITFLFQSFLYMAFIFFVLCLLKVYFMDTQIWYSVFCTIFGGVYGILHHIGEVISIFLINLHGSGLTLTFLLQIRTLGMLRSRFHSLPCAFNLRLIAPSSRNDYKKRIGFFLNRFQRVWDFHNARSSQLLFRYLFILFLWTNNWLSQVSKNKKNSFSRFALVWNQIINKFRLEDLISNRWFYCFWSVLYCCMTSKKITETDRFPQAGSWI